MLQVYISAKCLFCSGLLRDSRSRTNILEHSERLLAQHFEVVLAAIVILAGDTTFACFTIFNRRWRNTFWRSDHKRRAEPGTQVYIITPVNAPSKDTGFLNHTQQYTNVWQMILRPYQAIYSIKIMDPEIIPGINIRWWSKCSQIIRGNTNSKNKWSFKNTKHHPRSWNRMTRSYSATVIVFERRSQWNHNGVWILSRRRMNTNLLGAFARAIVSWTNSPWAMRVALWVYCYLT